jgi:hypothetical protein
MCRSTSGNKISFLWDEGEASVKGASFFVLEVRGFVVIANGVKQSIFIDSVWIAASLRSSQ